MSRRLTSALAWCQDWQAAIFRKHIISLLFFATKLPLTPWRGHQTVTHQGSSGPRDGQHGPSGTFPPRLKSAKLMSSPRWSPPEWAPEPRRGLLTSRAFGVKLLLYLGHIRDVILHTTWQMELATSGEQSQRRCPTLPHTHTHIHVHTHTHLRQSDLTSELREGTHSLLYWCQ